MHSSVEIKTDPNKVKLSDHGISSLVFICNPLSNNLSSYNCHEFLSQKVYLLRVMWFQLGGVQINALEGFMGSNNLMMIHACIKHLYRLDHPKCESSQAKPIQELKRSPGFGPRSSAVSLPMQFYRYTTLESPFSFADTVIGQWSYAGSLGCVV